MRKLFLCVMYMIAAGVFSTASWSEEKDYSIYSQEGREFEWEEIYAPRYPDRLCPPEYPRTRERVESYVSNPNVGFQERFGTAAPRSPANIEVLDDLTDAEACRYFNEWFDEKINTQVKLTEESVPQYWFDVTYYEGGNFYFVVSDGGIVTEDDPEKPGWIRSVQKRTSLLDDSLLVFRKDKYEPVAPYIVEPLESDSAKDR